MKLITFAEIGPSPQMGEIRDWGAKGKDQAVGAYKTARANGNDCDNPHGEAFPRDGKFSIRIVGPYLRVCGWVLHALRYTPGPRDRKWMQERDKKYVFRLVHERKLSATEPNLRREVPELYALAIAEQVRFEAAETAAKKETEETNTEVTRAHTEAKAAETAANNATTQLRDVRRIADETRTISSEILQLQGISEDSQKIAQEIISAADGIQSGGDSASTIATNHQNAATVAAAHAEDQKRINPRDRIGARESANAAAAAARLAETAAAHVRDALQDINTLLTRASNARTTARDAIIQDLNIQLTAALAARRTAEGERDAAVAARKQAELERDEAIKAEIAAETKLQQQETEPKEDLETAESADTFGETATSDLISFIREFISSTPILQALRPIIAALVPALGGSLNEIIQREIIPLLDGLKPIYKDTFDSRREDIKVLYDTISFLISLEEEICDPLISHRWRTYADGISDLIIIPRCYNFTLLKFPPESDVSLEIPISIMIGENLGEPILVQQGDSLFIIVYNSLKYRADNSDESEKIYYDFKKTILTDKYSELPMEFRNLLHFHEWDGYPVKLPGSRALIDLYAMINSKHVYTPAQIKLGGWNQRIHLFLEACCLLSLIISINNNSLGRDKLASVDQKTLLAKLLTELAITLEALRSIVNVLNATQKKDEVVFAKTLADCELVPEKARNLTRDIISKINNLNDGEEFVLPTGFDVMGFLKDHSEINDRGEIYLGEGHAIYIAFQRKGNEIMVRVDNAGYGSSREFGYHHRDDKDMKIYSRVIAKFNRGHLNNIVSEEYIRLEAYVLRILGQNIPSSFEYDYPSAATLEEKEEIIRVGLIEEEENELKKIYQFVLSVDAGIFLEDEKEMRARWPQMIGNCVVRSFEIGQANRLGWEIYKWIKRQEKRFSDDFSDYSKVRHPSSGGTWGTNPYSIFSSWTDVGYCFDRAVGAAYGASDNVRFQQLRLENKFKEDGSLDRRQLIVWAFSHEAECIPLVAPEIREAAVIPGALPRGMETEELQRLVDAYTRADDIVEVRDTVSFCNNAIGSAEGHRLSFAQLEEYFVSPDHRSGNAEAWLRLQSIRDRYMEPSIALHAYCSKPEVYRQYINSYYGHGGWFAFQRGFGINQQQTSMIDVAARFLGKNIAIHQSTSDGTNELIYTGRSNHVGDETIHIRYTRENNHFFFDEAALLLVPRLEHGDHHSPSP